MKHAMLGVLILLSGCGMFAADRPQVTLDYGTACLAYADGKAAISVGMVRLVDACVTGAMTPAVCGDLDRARDRLALAEMYIRDQLKDPKTPVDWAKVNAFLQEVLGIAIKLGAKAL